MNTEVIKRDNLPSIELTYHGDVFALRPFVDRQIRVHSLKKNGDRMLTVMAIQLLERAIIYGIEHHNNYKNELAYYLYDVLPEVDFAEIVAYCSNDILNNNARTEKYYYWDHLEDRLTVK